MQTESSESSTGGSNSTATVRDILAPDVGAKDLGETWSGLVVSLFA